MSEVVENGNRGIVIGLGDTRALAEAILRPIEDDDLWTSMSQAALKPGGVIFSGGRICKNPLALYACMFQHGFGKE